MLHARVLLVGLGELDLGALDVDVHGSPPNRFLRSTASRAAAASWPASSSRTTPRATPTSRTPTFERDATTAVPGEHLRGDSVRVGVGLGVDERSARRVAVRCRTPRSATGRES